MKITLLCNAGLALQVDGYTLLIDVPNHLTEPFCELKADLWHQILQHEPPYDRICGLVFTHTHPDHYDRNKVEAYLDRWPDTPIFLPDNAPNEGKTVMGPFTISYARLEHAPMEPPPPPHVVAWVQSGSQSVYIAGDAKLDVDLHQQFLKGRRANAAFWNSMYLSLPQTRQLLRCVAERNYIYHMPETNPDGHGLWRKCQHNFRRYGVELEHVSVLDRYPATVEI